MKYCVFPLGSWNGFDIVLPTRLVSTAVLYRIGSNGVRDRVPAAKLAGGACGLAPDVEDERSVGGAHMQCASRVAVSHSRWLRGWRCVPEKEHCVQESEGQRVCCMHRCGCFFMSSGLQPPHFGQ